MAKPTHRVALGGAGALIITVALAASAWAMSPGGKHADPEKRLDRLTQRLDLSQQQQTDIGALLEQGHASREADAQRLKSLRQVMQEQRTGFDPGTAQATADEIGQITSRLVYSRVNTHAQVYGLLTPEQQEKMDKAMADRKERKRHSRWHRHNG